MKPAEAAMILEVAPSTVRAMLRDGRLEGLIIEPARPGGKPIYRVNDRLVVRSEIEPELRLDNL